MVRVWASSTLHVCGALNWTLHWSVVWQFFILYFRIVFVWSTLYHTVCVCVCVCVYQDSETDTRARNAKQVSFAQPLHARNVSVYQDSETDTRDSESGMKCETSGF